MMITINASDLSRFMACNGSYFMTPSIPGNSHVSNTTREEGNAAHFMAVSVFRGHYRIEEMVDRKAPNGVYMTDEMAEHVSAYMDYLLNRQQDVITQSDMEVDVTFPGVNARADHAAVSYHGCVYVDEFKYGWRTVEPENNWTLIAYAIGYVMKLQIVPDSIHMSVYQPRPYHQDGPARTWSIGYNELLAYHGMLQEALLIPSQTLNTGPHCYRCPSVANCAAARKAGMNALEASDIVFDDQIGDDELAFELDILSLAQKTLETRRDALEELAKHRLRKGAVIENYTLNKRLTNTRWKDTATPDLLLAMTGQNLTVSKLVTPAEAKRRGMDETLIKAFTERVETGEKLNRESAHKKAMRLFGSQ